MRGREKGRYKKKETFIYIDRERERERAQEKEKERDIFSLVFGKWVKSVFFLFSQ